MSATAFPFCVHLEYRFFFPFVYIGYYYGIWMPDVH